MHYDDLRKRPIEDLVNEVQALASVASQSQVQSIAALGARLTIELASGLQELTGTLFTAKAQLVGRLDSLTEQIKAAQLEIARASDAASKQTEALVYWTRVLVVVTTVYTLITGGLLLVAALRAS